MTLRITLSDGAPAAASLSITVCWYRGLTPSPPSPCGNDTQARPRSNCAPQKSAAAVVAGSCVSRSSSSRARDQCLLVCRTGGRRHERVETGYRLSTCHPGPVDHDFLRWRPRFAHSRSGTDPGGGEVRGGSDHSCREDVPEGQPAPAAHFGALGTGAGGCCQTGEVHPPGIGRDLAAGGGDRGAAMRRQWERVARRTAAGDSLGDRGRGKRTMERRPRCRSGGARRWPEDGTSYLTALGADGKAGDPERVERSVPLRVGLERGLLALGLNGELLSRSHGGPVRLVIPGYFAVNSVKWVVRLALTADESDASIQTVRYRLTPPGSTSGPDDPSCWEMPVKSWVTSPEQGAVAVGMLEVEGVAFSGSRPGRSGRCLRRRGKTWRPTALGPSDGPAAWSTFKATIEVGPSGGLIASRARDAAGNEQPARSVPDINGYAPNGWLDHAVQVAGEPTAHPVRVTFPLLMTGLPLSTLIAVTSMWSPSSQMLVTKVSPGRRHREPRPVPGHPAHVAVEGLVHHRFAHHPERAEAVEDGPFEPRHRGEPRVGVERVLVAG